MRMSLTKTVKLAVVIVILSLSAGAFLQVADASGTRAGTSNVDFMNVNANAGTVFMGETGSFYVYIGNIYDGSYWAGGSSGVGLGVLYRCSVDVRYNDVIDEDGNSVDSIIEPAEKWSLNPYNGVGGSGFNITSYRYYFSDEDSNYLKFQIRFAGVKAGNYRIPLTIRFEIRRDYTDPTHTEYDYLPFNVFEYAHFSIRSNVNGVSGAVESMNAYEGEDPVPLYSGSRNMLLQKDDISSHSGRDLTEFEALLYSPDGALQIYRSRLDVSRLTIDTRDLRWSVDVAPDAAPGIHTVTIIYMYNLNQETMSEGPYKMEIEIEPTPLIEVTDSTGYEAPTAYVEQKENIINLSLFVKNVGNVDLTFIKLYLDLDSASYFTNDDIYYSEDSFGTPQIKPAMLTITKLDMGSSEHVKFVNVSINMMLPPGMYRIPIDYEVSYEDPESPGQFIRLTSYQMDEIGKEDFMEMQYFRSHPREMDGYPPYILVDVVDDMEGLDILAECDTPLVPGVTDQELAVRIVNWENYRIENVDLELISSDPDVIRRAGFSSSSAELASEAVHGIDAGSFTEPGTMELTTRVDVAVTSSESLECFLLVSGYDNFGESFNKNISFKVNLIQVMPEIEILSVLTGAVRPGSDFDMEIIITNSGTVPIGNYSVFVSSSSSVFMIENAVVNGEGLEPGEIDTVSFTIRGSREISEDGQYMMTVMFEIESRTGQFEGFGDSETEIVIIESEGPKDEEVIGWSRGSIGFVLLLFISFAAAALCIAALYMVYRYNELILAIKTKEK